MIYPDISGLFLYYRREALKALENGDNAKCQRYVQKMNDLLPDNYKVRV